MVRSEIDLPREVVTFTGRVIANAGAARRLAFATVLLMNGAQSGCARTTTAEAPARRVVLVDSRSGAVFTTDMLPHLPAKNPHTGKATLMHGMYCPVCERWRPTPPPDVLQRLPGARACPKTKSELLLDGPLPANTAVWSP